MNNEEIKKKLSKSMDELKAHEADREIRKLGQKHFDDQSFIFTSRELATMDLSGLQTFLDDVKIIREELDINYEVAASELFGNKNGN